MIHIIGVRFKKVGKVYYFDPHGLTVRPGEHVIVETARGIECGECVVGNTEIAEEAVVRPLKPVIRIATETDLQVARGNAQQAREAYTICKKKIAEHGLDMNLVSVECTFDLNKILFYFTSDGRVDFRALVKDLASIFRTRIELRQIGVRDEAKMIGGLGICGRELCCASYLDDFQPVSINMAKDQNLSLNPAKISGTCGRLMCCLKYEYESYHELQKVTPKVDSLVETPEGRGTVVSTQILCGTCKVQLEDSPDTPQVFCCKDCTMLRSGRGKRGPQPDNHRAPADDESTMEPLEKRKPTPTVAAEEPAAADAETPAEEKPRRRRSGSRRRRRKPAGEGGEGRQSAIPPQGD